MNILNRTPRWTRPQIDTAIEHGWDQAEVTGRAHLTRMIATTSTMVVLKDFDGRTTLIPYDRITDIHQAEGATA